MKKHEDEIRYYHGGLGAEENRRDFDRRTRDGDFGREYENRYRHHHHPQDYRDRRDYDAHRFDDYLRHAEELEANYHRSTYRHQTELGDIRQGYGYPEFSRHNARHHNPAHDMERERRAQRERGGYSGSGYGGTNYSAHGEFGGAPGYGAMSGSGGNAAKYTSSSGYGGGHSDQRIYGYERRQNWGAESDYSRQGRPRHHNEDDRDRSWRNRP